ncbi:MAG: cyclic di-GMP-binding protein FimX [Candidatus Pelagadaptatus aseana]|uniref:EAL domain-containing response regulator n=1 Tax=Candidatus Pelagadaptatus aseana TaxID=3120508 RepID=UPI0039B31227
MTVNDTIRLLIINDSRSEAERLISMLNNAGRSTRAQHVENEEGLVKLLQEQIWDLLIVHDKSTSVEPLTAIRQIKRLKKDVPVICLTDEEGAQPVVEALKMGATDAILLDEDQHLLLVISREVENRQQRRLMRQAERQFKEAERRSQQLLESSRDAIAYVQDGMYLFANQSFAERFGYEDKDDIECMPVIDMVVDDDQGKVKQFLKNYALKGDEAESCELEFQGLQSDGTGVPLKVNVGNALFEEEHCIQFMIPAKQINDQELEAELHKLKVEDQTTGLLNRAHFTERLDQELSQALNAESTSALIYVEVDELYGRLQEQMGVTAIDAIVADLACYVKQHCEDSHTAARFADDAFMILAQGANADQALAWSEKLRQDVEGHIIDVDGHTAQTTVSIGISLINETSSDAETIIDQAMGATESGADEDSRSNSVNLFEPELPEDEKKSADIAKMVQAAMDNGRFNLLYQPVISLRGSEDGFYEVLLRMKNEEGEEISPSDFLEIADEIGATTKIDRWVILESIKVLSKHRGGGSKTRMLVNVSRQSLIDESLLPWLAVAFKAAKLPTDAIVFQVGEKDVTNHLNAARDFFDGLREMGCFSSISNFGCSLNPFNTLAHANSDYVKVHGSFTRDIQNNQEGPEALSNLIKELLEHDKVTVVPFVENASVLSTLWQTGVHYIQGHYLQAPSEDMNYDFNMEE